MRDLEAFDDVADVVHAFSPGDQTNVVLVGLCSGAYQALEGALTLHPLGICLINPILAFDPPEAVSDRRRLAQERTKTWFVKLATRPVSWAERRWAPGHPGRWIRSLAIATWPAAIARRYPQVPPVVWWAIKHALIDNRAVAVLENAVGAGVAVTLVCSVEDTKPIVLGEERAVARLATSDRFVLDVLPDLDHAGLIVKQRSLLMQAVTRNVVSRFGPNSASSSDPITVG